MRVVVRQGFYCTGTFLGGREGVTKMITLYAFDNVDNLLWTTPKVSHKQPYHQVCHLVVV